MLMLYKLRYTGFQTRIENKQTYRVNSSSKQATPVGTSVKSYRPEQNTNSKQTHIIIPNEWLQAANNSSWNQLEEWVWA